MPICIVICLSLAYWQSGRIEEKQALQLHYDTMLSEAALNLNDISDFETLANMTWQPVRVHGEFLKPYQFLLDSQVYQGKPGYHVIAPLRIDGSDHIILVNRGWIAAGNNRRDIPNIAEITETQPIQGQLAKPKSTMPGFENTDISDPVQLFINLEALSVRIGAPIAPMLIQLDVRATGSLPREWPKYDAKIEMHEFYVIHWLIAAFLSVLLYVYFAYKEKA